jgi:hypothetical protein
MIERYVGDCTSNGGMARTWAGEAEFILIGGGSCAVDSAETPASGGCGLATGGGGGFATGGGGELATASLAFGRCCLALNERTFPLPPRAEVAGGAPASNHAWHTFLPASITGLYLFNSGM